MDRVLEPSSGSMILINPTIGMVAKNTPLLLQPRPLKKEGQNNITKTLLNNHATTMKLLCDSRLTACEPDDGREIRRPQWLSEDPALRISRMACDTSGVFSNVSPAFFGGLFVLNPTRKKNKQKTKNKNNNKQTKN